LKNLQKISRFLVPGLKFANGNKKEFAPFFTKNFILFWLKNPSKKFFFVFVDFFWKLKKARLKNFLFAALFLLPNPFWGFFCLTFLKLKTLIVIVVCVFSPVFLLGYGKGKKFLQQFFNKNFVPLFQAKIRAKSLR